MESSVWLIPTSSAIVIIQKNIPPHFGLVILLCCALAEYGNTQEQPDSTDSFLPELGVVFRHDDNIYRSATSVTSSWITLLSPGLSITAQPSRQRYTLKYNGDIAFYDEGSADNYDDHHFEAGAYLELGARAKLDLIGSYSDSHDDRGSGLTDGFDPLSNTPPVPHEHQLSTLRSNFSYGIVSKGRMVVEAGASNLEYTNDLNRTRFYDRSEGYGGAGFYYRVMPNTSLLVDARITTFDYQNDRPSEPSLDSKETRYVLGVTWDNAAKTTGTVKVGYVKKTFDDSVRGDFSSSNWEVDVRWSPRSYSHFDLKSARTPSESNGGGDFIDSTSYSVAWEHEWRRRLKSRFVARRFDQDYLGSTVNRNQQLTQYTFSLSYDMNRWLEWTVSAEMNSRNSNISRLEYDGNIYSIGALIRR